MLTSPPAHGVHIDGVPLGYMRDEAHDLVVPLESALGFGAECPR